MFPVATGPVTAVRSRHSPTQNIPRRPSTSTALPRPPGLVTTLQQPVAPLEVQQVLLAQQAAAEPAQLAV